MLHYAYHSHGITLEQQLDPALPALEMDADQVSQVIMNLLINAQQALADREGPRRVCSSTGLMSAGGKSHVWLRVQDSGPGVAPELRERIFETLFTTKAPGLGTGLGLSVSRSLAQAHGGDLVLEPDAPGRGASFLLTLPLAEGAMKPVATAAVEEDAPKGEPRAATVLIVDDEPELCDLMRDMLEDEGFTIITATSARAALELLGATPCDAIVSDMRMPDMDGPAFWHEVSSRHPQLQQRMMFASGDTLSRGVREFIERSGCLGLPKPFARTDLLAGVQSLLQRGAGAAATAPRN